MKKTAEEKRLDRLSKQLQLLDIQRKKAEVPYHIWRFREASRTGLKRNKRK